MVTVEYNVKGKDGMIYRDDEVFNDISEAEKTIRILKNKIG